MNAYPRAAIYTALSAMFVSASLGAEQTPASEWSAGPRIIREASLMRSVRYSAKGDELLTLADCTRCGNETLWLDHRKPASGEIIRTRAESKGIASWTFSQTADAKTVAFGISTDDDKGKLEGRLLLWDRDSASPKIVMRQAGFLRFVAVNEAGTRCVVALQEEENQNVHVKVQVWELATGKLLRTLLDSNDLVTSLAFSRDGSTTAIGVWKREEGSVRQQVLVWDTQTGEVRRRFTGEDAAFGSAIQFSPDGKLLAISGSRGVIERANGVVQLWDLATGKSVRTFKGLKSPASSIAFTSDGSLLAATGSALPSGAPEVMIGGLAVWDTMSGSLLNAVEETGFVMTAAAFAPEGKRLAVSGYATVPATSPDGLLRIYSRK